MFKWEPRWPWTLAEGDVKVIQTPTGLPLATPTSHGYTGTVTLTLFLQQMSSTFCYFYNYLTLQLLKIQLLSGSIIEINNPKYCCMFFHLYFFVPNSLKSAKWLGRPQKWFMILLIIGSQRYGSLHFKPNLNIRLPQQPLHPFFQ